MESAISGNFGKYGDCGDLPELRGDDADKRVLGNDGMGGRNDVLMGDLVGGGFR